MEKEKITSKDLRTMISKITNTKIVTKGEQIKIAENNRILNLEIGKMIEEQAFAREDGNYDLANHLEKKINRLAAKRK